MALNFPDSPSVNDVYRDTTSGFSYQWDGTVWQSYSDSSLGQIKILDDISGSFNGSTQTFALTSSSTAVVPANAQQVRVVLGGVVQDPADDYTVSGSNITFTTPPTGGLSFSGIVFGTAVPILDGTVTPSKLSTGAPSWNTSGDVYISGITTITNDLELIRGSKSGGLTRKLIIGGARSLGSDFATLQFKNFDSNSSSVDYIAAEIKGSVPDAADDGGELVFLTAADGATSQTERVRITSAGDVGIGTDNPSYKLQVEGNARITGIVTATSFNGSGSELIGISTNFVSAIGIQSAGTVIGAGITQLNFIGAGNTFAVNGTTVDISISGSGGGGGGTGSFNELDAVLFS